VWLRVVCDWLGTEFSRLRTTVNQHVDVFKADHIANISDLPSAQTVVHRLFPHCMILLLLRWMSANDLPKFRDGQTVEGTSVAWHGSELDHSYAGEDFQKSKLFSFIQLILEFANGCLVSGIAHVLYPRLMQAQL